MGIEMRNLTKRLGGETVIEGVDLSVRMGEILFVVGESGAGKSVLMRHVIGLHKPDWGSVYVDGERVDSLPEKKLYTVRERCGFVFQHPALLDFLSLEGNVAMPLRRRRGMGGTQAAEEARLWLRRVGIVDEGSRFPDEVGAGVKKRASIARVLALQPRYVVYDEPTTGLDPVSARRIDALIKRHAEEQDVSTIVVSHDLRSLAIAHRVAFLHRGRLRATGTLDELRASSDPVVRRFLLGGNPQSTEALATQDDDICYSYRRE